MEGDGYSRASYGGMSIDQRRARRRRALLDAAIEIIGTSGFAKLTRGPRIDEPVP
ncbi:hypothetical protein ACQP2U_00540 [Nocardia sp. CA-084685]|uniref:hypothetical protein n=1 Tax=Nocardia sp. CA-084685 TaxID=3239970 RepID=UPI003D97D98D